MLSIRDFAGFGAAVVVAAGVMGAGASAQWSSDPMTNLALAALPASQELPKIVATPDGGCFVSWYDTGTGVYTIRIQKLNAAGLAQFGPNGALVDDRPQLTSLVDYDLAVDTDGSAYVAFTETSNGSDRDIRITKVLSDGSVAWSTMLSDDSNFEADPRVIVRETPQRRVVVTWMRGDSNRGIFMQQIDPATGAIALPFGGERIAGDGVEGPAFHEMIPSGDGQFIMVWVRDTRTFASPRHVRIQKFDMFGVPQWNGNGGEPVVVMDTTVVPIAHRPRLVSNNEGGAVVAWHDSRSGSSNCYVQRYDSLGVATFAAQGAAVATGGSNTRFDPAIVQDEGTGQITVFYDERGAGQGPRGIFAQRFSPFGVRNWGNMGREIWPVDNVTEGTPRAVYDGQGGAIVFAFRNPVFGGQETHVVAMRVDPSGSPVWSPATLEVSNNPSSKGRLSVARNGAGMAMALWEDARNDVRDLYIQNVNVDGTLGASGPAADLNGDGVVNSGDLAVLLGSWGACPGCPGDLDGDGIVGASDLAILLGSWG